MILNIEKIRAKSLIRSSNHKSQHHLNPFQGCYHDCKYCLGKSESYFLHEDYSNTIKIKENAPELLEEYLIRRGHYPIDRKKTETLVDFMPSMKDLAEASLPEKFILFVGGSICDVFQPHPDIQEATRKLLQIACDYRFPIRLLTKNSAVTREVDLLSKIHNKAFARASVTITLADEHDQHLFEPRASSTSERYEAVRQLREKGLPSGIYMTPLLPYIGDTPKNIDQLFKRAKEVDAEFVITGGLILRPGRNKEEYLSIIKDYYPEYLDDYTKLYINNHPGGQPDTYYTYQLGIPDIVLEGYKKSKIYDIPFFEPRYIPKGPLYFNKRVATVLSRVAFLKSRILKESEIEASRIQKDSIFLEKYSISISRLSSSEYYKLPLHKESQPYIENMLENDQSEYLQHHKEWGNLFYSRT